MALLVLMAVLIPACTEQQILLIPRTSGVYDGATYWDDLRTNAENLRLPGSNPAEFVTYKTIFSALAFDATNNEYAQANFQMPHAWSEGTSVHYHVHFVPASNATGTVIFCTDYIIASPNGYFSTSKNSCGTANVSAEQDRHRIVEIADINMTGHTVSAVIKTRIYRNATGDNFTGDVHVEEVDMHYETNSPGSREEYLK